jgi:hypothetical protein
MLYLATLLASWLAWLIFADKRRWRELVPVSLLSMALGFFTDAIMHHYKLWEYYDRLLAEPYIELSFGFGIYPVVAYLFVQWLPKPSTRARLVLYWLAWTTLTISIEFLYTVTGHMTHRKWWTIAHSYAADWFILLLLYKFHRIFRLERLSEPRPSAR